MSRERIEIPGDWQGRDRHLWKLAQQTGFQTISKLLAHFAYELSHAKDPAQFYRACGQFYEHATKRRNRYARRAR